MIREGVGGKIAENSTHLDQNSLFLDTKGFVKINNLMSLVDCSLCLF